MFLLLVLSRQICTSVGLSVGIFVGLSSLSLTAANKFLSDPGFTAFLEQYPVLCTSVSPGTFLCTSVIFVCLSVGLFVGWFLG